MSIKQAQLDRGTALSSIQNLEGTLANFKIFFEGFKELKDEVFADNERKEAIINYFNNCDCDYSWSDIVSKYSEFKEIYDYLIEIE